MQWNKDHEDWEPCRPCQIAIEEVFEPLSEKEIDYDLQREEPTDVETEEDETSEQTQESS